MTLPQTRDTTRKISSLTSTVRTGEHCLEQAGDWGMSSNREAAPGWAGRDQASREALVVWEEQAGWSPHTGCPGCESRLKVTRGAETQRITE